MQNQSPEELDSFFECPFCDYAIDMAEDIQGNACEHLVSVSYEDEDNPEGYYLYLDSYDTDTSGYAVCRKVRSLDASVFSGLLEQAPPDIRPLLELARTEAGEEVCLTYDVNNVWGDKLDLTFQPGSPITQSQATTLEIWLTQQT